MASGKSIWVKIFGDNSGLKKSMKESEKVLDNFGKTIKKVGGFIASAFAVQSIVRFGKEAINLAASGEGVRKAFQRIADDDLLDDLRASVKGSVTDLELMRRAVQANNFDIPLENLASLFKFAAKRAQETGESVDYLVNSIVLGIGRKSPLILDNLGISAVRLRKELKGAGTEMSTVGDIAAAVGKIAQGEMKKAGDIVETTGLSIEQMSAQWGNIKEELGLAVIELSGLNQSLGELTDILQELDIINSVKDFKEWKDQWGGIGKTVKAIVNPIKGVYEYNKLFIDLIRKAKKDELPETIKELYNPWQGSENKFSGISGLLKKTEDVSKELPKVKKESKSLIDLLTDESAWEEYILDDINNDIREMTKPGGALPYIKESFHGLNTEVGVVSESLIDMSGVLENALGMAATSFGEALGGAESLADALTDVSSAVMQNIGQLMLAVGVKTGNYALAIAGLATMGVGAFAGVVGQRDAAMVDIKNAYAESGIKASARDIRRMHRYNRIHANDIATANDYAVDFNNRVG